MDAGRGGRGGAGGGVEMLVLSLFPGIGLLDMAFEEEGFCVVRGPDLLWGGRIESFHPPAGKFDGVIGGPPCQIFSQMRHLNPHAGQKQGNLIPEFERCINEAQPEWFLMENVTDAPEPSIGGYIVRSLRLNNRWLAEAPEQNRERRFSFGTRDGRSLVPYLEFTIFEAPIKEFAVTAGNSRKVPVKFGSNGKPKPALRAPTVTSGHGAVMPHERGNFSLADACRLQGLPEGFLDDAPFTAHGKRKVIGNGVPLPTGRAIAKAIKEALAT